MKWLIVEDALRDRVGHWFEYLVTFRRGLEAVGDQVTILGSRECIPEVLAALQVGAVLPNSIWARISNRDPAWQRFLRVPFHALNTFMTLRKVIHTSGQVGAPDIIFVPTALVHHLLGWWLIIKAGLLPKASRLLVFFPNLPIEVDESDKPRWEKGPTVWLKQRIFQSLRRAVESKKIILGVETHAMQRALQTLIQMPVTYFPHPVEALPNQGQPLAEASAACQDKESVPTKPIVFACYGVARWEKGTDILQAGIRRALKEDPEIPAKFVFQWLDDFRDLKGNQVRLDPWLKNHPKVEVIERYFKAGEYEQRLAETDVMVLPYRAPYRLRVSRVMVEALVNGMPAITTNDKTLGNERNDCGSVVVIEENSPSALADAMSKMVQNFASIRRHAMETKQAAQIHFSVRNFRSSLPNYVIKTQPAKSADAVEKCTNEQYFPAKTIKFGNSLNHLTNKKRKTVGIVSLYEWLDKWDNYGTLLQNYALQKVLVKNGYAPFWIRTKNTNSGNLWRKVINFFLQLVLSPGQLTELLRMKSASAVEDEEFKKASLAKFNAAHPRHFERFMRSYLLRTRREFSVETMQQEFPLADAYVVGSDNIWARVTDASFLNFRRSDSLKVAYAVSAPWTQLSRYWYHKATPLVRKFASLSVRETQGIDVCRKMGRSDAVHVLDPTLLLRAEDYNEISSIDDELSSTGGFVLGYFVNLSKLGDIPWNDIHGFAIANRAILKVIPLQGAELVIPEEYVYAPCPGKWVSAFARARYVVTNSYHGAIFSILMRKPFLVITQSKQHDRGGERIPNLLQLLGLDSRFYSNKTDLQAQMMQPIGWPAVEQRLEAWRLKSLEFLSTALSSL